MVCKNCKRQIDDDSIFCKWCGEKQIRERKKKGEVKVPKPRQLKSGEFIGQIMIDGTRHTVKGATVAEYEAKCKAYKAGIVEADKPKKGKTLGKAMADFNEKRTAVVSPSTALGYDCIAKTRFAGYRDKGIFEIDYQKMVNDEADTCSPKTLKNAWGFVALVLEENGVQVPNIRLPQVVKKETPWLDYEQIQVFMQAIEGKPGELSALLALHSLRRSELLAITAENVDLKNEKIIVHGSAVIGLGNKLVYKETNKNVSSRRDVPIMIPRLKTLLADAVGKYPSGPLIRCNPNSMHGQINAVCEKAGLPKVGVHGLRRSFASLAYHLGWSELETMRVGGWSDYKTMRDYYTKLSDRDLAQSTQRMKQFYLNGEITNGITTGVEKIQ